MPSRTAPLGAFGVLALLAGGDAGGSATSTTTAPGQGCELVGSSTICSDHGRCVEAHCDCRFGSSAPRRCHSLTLHTHLHFFRTATHTES